MKISRECWHCGCKKIKYKSSKYCVFDNEWGAAVMKDEPDKCSFIDENSDTFKNVYNEFQKKSS
jgi:predicted  nucleic acid-binding Zn-ribbon protein